MAILPAFRDTMHHRSTGLAQFVLERAATRLTEGQLVVTYPGGATRAFGGACARPNAALRIRNGDLFWRVLLHGEVGLGEAYVDGLWETDDLVGLVTLGLRNRGRISLNHLPSVLPSRSRHRRLHHRNSNTRAGSRRNIHAHYDLGNDFFRLFLDESLGYSCPVYLSEDNSVAEGQLNKYRMLCEKVGMPNANRVLEIGAGWGGFALFAAREYGCHITTITISRQQYMYVRTLVEQQQLSSLIDVQLCDYRDVTGMYDVIVSIEMVEHVGEPYYPLYFQVCDRVLRPGGRMAMQFIGVEDRIFAERRGSVSWIQKHIYPGATLPSISVIEGALASTRLRLMSAEEIGQHYPRTLQWWRQRLIARSADARALGFDDRFIRMWEYYLATCEACFRTGYFRDLQIVLDTVR